jgi:IS5 family transposase
MRVVRNHQLPLAAPSGSHQHTRELQAISMLLDQHPEIARLAHSDLTGGKRIDIGRAGMTGEQTIRAAIVKQIHRLSYRELCFHLQDSMSFQAFCRLPYGKPLTHSTLQANIKRLRPQTWEAVNRILLENAAGQGIEDGRKVRVDCTAVESNIHAPTDSSLLEDCVRVTTRLLRQLADTVPSLELSFSDHTKRAKRRAYTIAFPPKNKKSESHRARAYRDLLKVANKTYGYGRTVLEQLRQTHISGVRDHLELQGLNQELSDVLDSMARVINQTTRRIIHDQKVPSSEKLVSIFETHTDIIVKGERETVFGHKVCLTGGASSMILDCVVEQGNPADSTLVERTMQRQIDIYGTAPHQASFDGGFASKNNLKVAKDVLGVQDVAFHKKCGLEITDMVKSAWVFERLRRFRAGIEGCISTLKRAFRMDRCNWRGFRSFESYVWACVVSFNLIVMARHLLT